MHLKRNDKEICQVCVTLNHNTMHIGGEIVCEHNALQFKNQGIVLQNGIVLTKKVNLKFDPV